MFAMKIVFLGVVIATVFADEGPNPTVEILTEKTYVREDGYNFEFKTSDGTSRKEEGNLITIGEHKGIGVRGSYTFTAPDGHEYEVTFTADDKGYNPTIRIVNDKQ